MLRATSSRLEGTDARERGHTASFLMMLGGSATRLSEFGLDITASLLAVSTLYYFGTIPPNPCSTSVSYTADVRTISTGLVPASNTLVTVERGMSTPTASPERPCICDTARDTSCAAAEDGPVPASSSVLM